MALYADTAWPTMNPFDAGKCVGVASNDGLDQSNVKVQAGADLLGGGWGLDVQLSGTCRGQRTAVGSGEYTPVLGSHHCWQPLLIFSSKHGCQLADRGQPNQGPTWWVSHFDILTQMECLVLVFWLAVGSQPFMGNFVRNQTQPVAAQFWH